VYAAATRQAISPQRGCGFACAPSTLRGSLFLCWGSLRHRCRRGWRRLAALQVGVSDAFAVLTYRTLRLRRAKWSALIAVALDVRANVARSTLASAARCAAPTAAATASAADRQQENDGGAHAWEGERGGVAGVHGRLKRTMHVGLKAKAWRAACASPSGNSRLRPRRVAVVVSGCRVRRRSLTPDSLDRSGREAPLHEACNRYVPRIW
jgi:hypothetical protein